MQFVFEAISPEGRVVHDVVDAESPRLAADALRGRGLSVLSIEESHASPIGGAVRGFGWAGVSQRDLVVFTRQMKMLLESGAALVQALEAIEKQTTKPALARMVVAIRESVENGGTLSEALAQHPATFTNVFRSMISAGEATASLSDAFARLSAMAERQQATRRMVLSALMYPAILSVLCLAVVAVMLTVVVPRFRDLFLSLNTPLPATTSAVLHVSEILTNYWPVIAGSVIGIIAACVVGMRNVATRRWIGLRIYSLPMLGRIASRLMVARVLRIWAAMLRSHVPLLETIRQSQIAVGNPVMLETLKRVEDAVSSGGRMGRTLASARFVEPVVASAISTGEENGRLGEAVEFVSTWMDDENAQLIATATRVVEPVVLACMGVVVGLVAMALFLPLFDMATMGGG